MHQNLSKCVENLKTQLQIPLLTYLLTPWRRFFLYNLTGSQLVKKFPEFYGTRRFITSFTSANQLSQPRGISTRFMPTSLTSRKFILLLSSHLCLGLARGSHPQISPTKFCIYLSSPP